MALTDTNSLELDVAHRAWSPIQEDCLTRVAELNTLRPVRTERGIT